MRLQEVLLFLWVCSSELYIFVSNELILHNLLYFYLFPVTVLDMQQNPVFSISAVGKSHNYVMTFILVVQSKQCKQCINFPIISF
jgi:hypothetical protein